MTQVIHIGECRAVMATLAADSIDAIVCDPPYGIGFMGKDWDSPRMLGQVNIDHDRERQDGGLRRGPGTNSRGYADNDPRQFQAWCEGWASEALRVLKPGGHLLAFGGTRAFHRMAVAIEDAGFEIRDQIAWMYGQGFPKSLDVSKAIDKAAGIEPEVVGTATRKSGNNVYDKRPSREHGLYASDDYSLTAPVSELAKQYAGWGTALKPAMEPIVLARKPLIGTVAANVAAHGTGALNIDACRIPTTDDLDGGAYAESGKRSVSPSLRQGSGMNQPGKTTNKPFVQPEGRWPANVCLDETAAALLDEQSGVSKSTGGQASLGAFRNGDIYGKGRDVREKRDPGYGDTGGASRFFFVARNEVQYDLNSQAERGDDWADQDHRQSIQADSATPPQRAITASTSGTRLPEKDAPSWPTSSNGSGITARSLTATRSITETATSKTTPSPTSNSLTPSRTSDCIPAANCEPERGGSHAAPVASSSQSTPSIGISALKDGRSTDDAAPAISARSLPISKGGVRFAYVPKASRRERNLGLPDGESSNHPTVKPVALMRWLVRLVTPPEGVVLDPFMGSGSTGLAAMDEGFRFIGIEQSAEYAAIAEARLRGWAPMFANVQVVRHDHAASEGPTDG